ncbi:riboflavin biosynthesis protein RibD [Komagataeibacter oboediens DSM 11826]|uniref:Riboflavin biosynthesis protein RibD n=1 Tax=Komagataeibacter oboediens TaxID=65958 RepID=A0A318QXN7_9PROT|nr:bifunctional diaminohydroxyphosphoribosylaminopyrimidine deaminase/5-amino-6-(5-phosphoribosylamino)uracil reductase RibD [Komagataeibacter oboediens]PYD82864.1 bifunctional diaminohydroxyphosphoribosylaminopyrimidine deaminase/5-amino-6-(5-phosphoribosylamino)uracil reductase [Komagataeibacter oboediens]GBR27973.1 riboflavin biosynthesis protein RibD [Komagataeibacter oboediens DSM 11826]
MPPAIAQAFRAAVNEAARHVGATAPNPPVGCTLLDRDGAILAVGGHHRAGTPHAEIQAINQCRERGLLDRAHTAVVTLEPCNHTGRTGPCSQALLATPVRDVWIGVRDPNPHVEGGGADHLRQHGCDVHVLHPTGPQGEIQAMCRSLLAPFAHFMRTGQPWITVKQALDATGSMVPPAGRTTFTSAASLDLAHRLRRATDAVITTGSTIRADNPGLNVRRVTDHPKRAPRVLAVCTRTGEVDAAYLQAAQDRGFAVQVCTDIAALPDMLGQAGVTWAMVEAGPQLLAEITARNLWHDWLAITAGHGGTDHYSIRVREGDVTPLHLFPELAAVKE